MDLTKNFGIHLLRKIGKKGKEGVRVKILTNPNMKAVAKV